VDWPVVMATTLLAMVPPVVVGVVMQKQFIAGMTETEKARQGAEPRRGGAGCPTRTCRMLQSVPQQPSKSCDGHHDCPSCRENRLLSVVKLLTPGESAPMIQSI